MESEAWVEENRDSWDDDSFVESIHYCEIMSWDSIFITNESESSFYEFGSAFLFLLLFRHFFRHLCHCVWYEGGTCKSER